jgi:hypothetical protein
MTATPQRPVRECGERRADAGAKILCKFRHAAAFSDRSGSAQAQFPPNGFILRDASLRAAPLDEVEQRPIGEVCQTLMVRSAPPRVSNHEASGAAAMIRVNRKTL